MEPKEVQTALITLGYDVGKAGADGIIGKDTKTAIAKFQADQKIVGDLGPLTIAKLQQQIADKPAGPVETSLDQMITRERILKFAPDATEPIVNGILAGLADIEAAKIVTPLRVQHWFSQIFVESWHLTRLEENLNYSAARLHKVWPKRFPTLASAGPYAHNPKGLAIKTYGDRLGNRPGTSDGWIFRGSGLGQTTGRDNFIAEGFADNPDALREMPGALHGSLDYWTKHGCNGLADKDDVTTLRKVIQGGDEGLDEAKAALMLAKGIFV